MEIKKEKEGEYFKGISVKKNENFSEWYSEVVQKCELADIRTSVKGCLVFQPWSVIPMEKMYKILEEILQRKKHKPYFFPTLIPESNLKKEVEHIEGFSPEVYWVTQGGDEKFEERLALRPTSETIIYPMFSLWIRSYKDLPFKVYQRANIFRYETKATRPFLRSREFYWIESHCAHKTEEDAMKQVYEDMETTEEFLNKNLGLPFIFFERPQWDKFAGAKKTFAADVLNPDGRVVQQPSTHLLGQDFAKAYDVKFVDERGKEQYAWLTCYGPAISRIFASVIISHGDDKGIRFPWKIAPIQVMIVPIKKDRKILEKAEEIIKKVSKYASIDIDLSDKTPGEKFNIWEMKGVPIRIDLGTKEVERDVLTIFRRDLNKKEEIPTKLFISKIKKIGKEYEKNLFKEANILFKEKIREVYSLEELKKAIEEGYIAKCDFCSIDKEGFNCAEIIEKNAGVTIRGKTLKGEKPKGKCIICKKEAKEVIYAARQY
ncbi:MAG: proline--tRNA ligase [Candidatus Pacearchaeota archaeon]